METRSSEEIAVHVRERADGQLTVSVQLVGWTSQHFTTLPQNEDLKSLIANKIGLAVVAHHLKKHEEGG